MVNKAESMDSRLLKLIFEEITKLTLQRDLQLNEAELAHFKICYERNLQDYLKNAVAAYEIQLKEKQPDYLHNILHAEKA